MCNKAAACRDTAGTPPPRLDVRTDLQRPDHLLCLRNALILTSCHRFWPSRPRVSAACLILLPTRIARKAEICRELCNELQPRYHPPRTAQWSRLDMGPLLLPGTRDSFPVREVIAGQASPNQCSMDDILLCLLCAGVSISMNTETCWTSHPPYIHEGCRHSMRVHLSAAVGLCLSLLFCG
ncbi:hypothetical protein FKP32DRAFT_436597 [Trametes sanguinea]|nr:hypothetical protein FKP32DRAFT_436597 [Trametes sanguinea]